MCSTVLLREGIFCESLQSSCLVVVPRSLCMTELTVRTPCVYGAHHLKTVNDNAESMQAKQLRCTMDLLLQACMSLVAARNSHTWLRSHVLRRNNSHEGRASVLQLSVSTTGTPKHRAVCKTYCIPASLLVTYCNRMQPSWIPPQGRTPCTVRPPRHANPRSGTAPLSRGAQKVCNVTALPTLPSQLTYK